MILCGEASLRRVIIQFLEHFHCARNHHGLDNQLTDPADGVGQVVGQIQGRERLGGMRNYYYRDAAWQ